MIYARRFGAFMPLLSLITTLILTYSIKPRLESWFPEHWPSVLVATGVGLLAGVYCIVYTLNLLSIRYLGKSELNAKLRKRWREILTSPSSSHSAATDYVDRVAELQVRISTPSLMREVVTELSTEQVAASTSLQRTIDQYVDRNELRAFTNVLANTGKAHRPSSFIRHV